MKNLPKEAPGAVLAATWITGLVHSAGSSKQHAKSATSRAGDDVQRAKENISEAMIRQRWESSRQNIIKLMPHLAELKVFDNSEDGDPSKGIIPEPRLLLHMQRGKVIEQVEDPPDWAKPILAAALPQ